jgi:hypothetical protein
MPSLMKLRIPLLLIIMTLWLTACSSANESEYASIPVGKAYADGEEIYFSHTETSDPDIAEKLTNMMKSPVLLVPSLAQAPNEMLANVYVFENGVTGKGPLGYQPDVFDNPPGTPGYSPLRVITLVNWKEAANARVLKSAQEVLDAEENGEVTNQKTGVVVNMPFMVWKGGQR